MQSHRLHRGTGEASRGAAIPFHLSGALSMKRYSLLCLLLPALVACQNAPPTDSVYLSADEKAAVLAMAKTDDLAAIKRLIAHYEAGPAEAVAVENWRARARKLGDPQELYHHAARRFAQAQDEPDPEQRAAFLAEALAAAHKSHAGSGDPSTMLLVAQIERAQEQDAVPRPSPDVNRS
ncbi:hypothetical protein [Stenotrophomonas sp.]|uniref:hypothetical protein n=1 Tax=Stenotrophomonas sp. TaxID=69392 RepID=UPI0029A3767B|nr:hypothetical protein [Stenotrophomonas sp.]MDX3934702.1 hypothetical protein [Stenotrophomonas sp.]